MMPFGSSACLICLVTQIPASPTISVKVHTWLFCATRKKQTKKINKYTKLKFCITQTSENFTSVHVVKISFPILSLLTLFSSVPRSLYKSRLWKSKLQSGSQLLQLLKSTLLDFKLGKSDNNSTPPQRSDPSPSPNLNPIYFTSSTVINF